MRYIKLDFKKIYLLIIAVFIVVNTSPLIKAFEIRNNKFDCEEQGVSQFVRSKIIDEGILCVETFWCHSEEISKENESVVYKKNLEVSKEFKTQKKDKKYKTVATCNSQMIFTYDKKSFVRVEDVSKDNEANISGEKWNLMNLREILPGEQICSLSTRCVLYKENLFGLYDYITNGHFDVFCSLNGEIGINTDLH